MSRAICQPSLPTILAGHHRSMMTAWLNCSLFYALFLGCRLNFGKAVLRVCTKIMHLRALSRLTFQVDTGLRFVRLGEEFCQVDRLFDLHQLPRLTRHSANTFPASAKTIAVEDSALMENSRLAESDQPGCVPIALVLNLTPIAFGDCRREIDQLAPDSRSPSLTRPPAHSRSMGGWRQR
jgi:hypothetical protein